jgi:hypothetical protein
MSHSIDISDETYRELRQRARQLALSPDAVAEDLLRRGLIETRASWRSDLEALVARIRSRASGQAPELIEADITAAAAEARAIRRGAHRR